MPKANTAAAGVRLHAAGAVYFAKDEDADIRFEFEYCKRAGIAVIVAGDPASGGASTAGMRLARGLTWFRRSTN
jgi:hypothetical protein